MPVKAVWRTGERGRGNGHRVERIHPVVAGGGYLFRRFLVFLLQIVTGHAGMLGLTQRTILSGEIFMRNKYFAVTLPLILMFVGVGCAGLKPTEPLSAGVARQPSQPPPTPVAQATYLCNDRKNITAAFFGGQPASVNPGEPPTPTGSVELTFDDGKTMELSQTLSADGARYAAADESLVFWSKGNGALVLEDGAEKNYVGCVTVAPDPGGLPDVYHDDAGGFSIRYPDGYTVDPAYVDEQLGPDKGIKGMKLLIPDALAAGTNLSSYDTGVAVETLPGGKDCQAGLFLDGQVTVATVTDGGTTYSYATQTQAAAGNRYEEDVWAIPGTSPCLAVRYLIHSMVFENYPPGAVTKFNRAALLDQFDKIRRSLVRP